MDKAIVDTMISVLYGSLVEPSQVRNAVLACLDLVPPGDSDGCMLRAIMEGDRDDALGEFRAAFLRVQARLPPRWVHGSGRSPRL